MAEKLFGYANNFGPATELNSVEEVACFIYENGQHGDVTIEKMDGTVFITTFGILLEKVSDLNYWDKLLKVLLPLQLGETTVSEIMARCGYEGGAAE